MNRTRNQVRVMDLTFDPMVYPRASPDRAHIARLGLVLRTVGDWKEPIVVEKGTLRIVDGVMRRAALLKPQGGGERMIPVQEEVFKDDAALIARAIALNSEHGLPYTPQDYIHAGHIGTRAGLSMEQIAQRLAVPAERFAAWVGERTAYSGTSSPAPPVVLKPVTQQQWRGQTLSPEQETVNARAGAHLLLPLRQTLDYLEHDLLAAEEARTIMLVEQLVEAGTRWLVRHPPPGD